MSIVIPQPLQWVSYLAGSKWPQGDEDKMFALADIWHAEAEETRALVPDLMRVRAELIDTLTGETAETAKQNFALLFDGDASVDKLSDAMKALGDLAYDTAGQIEANKIEILCTLAVAAADILYAIACAPFTFGASLSWIPAIEVFSVIAIRLLFEQLLRRIIAEAINALTKTSVQRLAAAASREAAEEILEESAINLGIQMYQVQNGHKHGFDVNSFGQSALAGFVGGSAGAGAGKGLSKLLGDSNNLTGKALRNAFTGYGSGLGGDLAATLATGGDIDAGTLFAGNASGGVSGALRGDGRGGHHLTNFLIGGLLGFGPTTEKFDSPGGGHEPPPPYSAGDVNSEQFDSPGGDHESPPPYSESEDPTQASPADSSGRSEPSATSPQSAVSHLTGQQGPETHPRGDVGGPTAPAPPFYDSLGHTTLGGDDSFVASNSARGQGVPNGKPPAAFPESSPDHPTRQAGNPIQPGVDAVTSSAASSASGYPDSPTSSEFSRHSDHGAGAPTNFTPGNTAGPTVGSAAPNGTTTPSSGHSPGVSVGNDGAGAPRSAAALNSSAPNSSAPNSSAPSASTPRSSTLTSSSTSSPGASAATGKAAQPHAGGSSSTATDSTPVPATHRATAPVATSTSSGATAHRPVVDGPQGGGAWPRRAAVPAPPPLPPTTTKPAVAGVVSGGAPPISVQSQHHPNGDVSSDESWRHATATTAGWFEPVDPTPDADVASRRDDAFAQTVDTEVADVLATSTPASIETHTGLIRYDLRRIEVAPDKFVQEYTVKLNVTPAGPSVGRDVVADVQRKARAGVDRILNHGNRLPSGDEFRVNVEFTDNGAHAAVKVGDFEENSQTTWRADISEDVLAHEILHYLGVPDENRDPRIALRRHAQNSGVHESDGGVMTSDVLGPDPSLRPRHLWIVERTANSQVSVPISLLTAADNARAPRPRSNFAEERQPVETRRGAGFEGELRGGYTVKLPAGQHPASYETVAENNLLSLTVDVHMNEPVLEIVTKPAAVVPGDEGRPTSEEIFDEVRKLARSLQEARKEASLARILEDRFRLDPDAEYLRAFRKDPARDVSMSVHHSAGIPLAGLTYFMECVRNTTRTDSAAAGAAGRHLADALAIARAFGAVEGWGAGASAAGRAAAEGFVALVYTQFAAMAQRVHSGTDWAKNYSAMNSRVSMAAVAEGLEPAVREHLDQHGPAIAERFAASFRDYLSEDTHDRNLLGTIIPDGSSGNNPTIGDYLHSAFSTDATRLVVNQTDALKVRTTLPELDTNKGRIDPPLVVVELRHLHKNNVSIEEVAQTHGILVERSRQAFERAHQLRGTSVYVGGGPPDSGRGGVSGSPAGTGGQSAPANEDSTGGAGRPAGVQPAVQAPITSIATSVFDPGSKKLNDHQRAELDSLARDMVDQARQQLEAGRRGLYVRAEGGGNGGRFSRGADAVGKERARVTLDYLRTRTQERLEARGMAPEAVTVSSEPISRGTALDDQLDGPDEAVRRTVKMSVEQRVPGPTLRGAVSGLPGGADPQVSAEGTEVPRVGAAAVRDSLPVTQQTHTDVEGWIGDVNNDGGPSVTPAGDRSTNCGPTTWAVFDRLSGIPSFGRAHPVQLWAQDVGEVTGLPLRASDPDAIADQLRAAGVGAHTVVVVQFDNGVAHSFNALFDGDGVWAIDGQSGTVTVWPPALGGSGNSVTNWFAGTPDTRGGDLPRDTMVALRGDDRATTAWGATRRIADDAGTTQPDLVDEAGTAGAADNRRSLEAELDESVVSNHVLIPFSSGSKTLSDGQRAELDRLAGELVDQARHQLEAGRGGMTVRAEGGGNGGRFSRGADIAGRQRADATLDYLHNRIRQELEAGEMAPDAIVVSREGTSRGTALREELAGLDGQESRRTVMLTVEGRPPARPADSPVDGAAAVAVESRPASINGGDEVLSRLAAGDVVSLVHAGEVGGLEESLNAARDRLRGLFPERIEHIDSDVAEMIDLLNNSRITINFRIDNSFADVLSEDDRSSTTGESSQTAYLNGWQRQAYSGEFANRRDETERMTGQYDGHEPGVDDESVQVVEARHRVNQYLSRESPNFSPSARPRYGALDYGRSFNGAAPGYGESFLVLREHVKHRATFTTSDSMQGDPTATSFLGMAQLLARTRDDDFRDIHRLATTGEGFERKKERRDPVTAADTNYLEAQLHTPIDFFRDIEAVSIDMPAMRQFAGDGLPGLMKTLRQYAETHHVRLELREADSVAIHDVVAYLAQRSTSGQAVTTARSSSDDSAHHARDERGGSSEDTESDDDSDAPNPATALGMVSGLPGGRVTGGVDGGVGDHDASQNDHLPAGADLSQIQVPGDGWNLLYAVALGAPPDARITPEGAVGLRDEVVAQLRRGDHQGVLGEGVLGRAADALHRVALQWVQSVGAKGVPTDVVAMYRSSPGERARIEAETEAKTDQQLRDGLRDAMVNVDALDPFELRRATIELDGRSPLSESEFDGLLALLQAWRPDNDVRHSDLGQMTIGVVAHALGVRLLLPGQRAIGSVTGPQIHLTDGGGGHYNVVASVPPHPRLVSEGHRHEVLSRLAAGDVASLIHLLEAQDGDTWSDRAHDRLRNTYPDLSEERVQRDIGEMVSLLQDSRVTVNFDAATFFDERVTTDSSNRTVMPNSWQKPYEQSDYYLEIRDETERWIATEGRDFSAVPDESASVRAVRDRVAATYQAVGSEFARGARPKYAALDFARGVDGGASEYGRSYLVLKDYVKHRATFTGADSLDAGDDVSDVNPATFFHLEKVLVDTSDNNFRAIHDLAITGTGFGPPATDAVTLDRHDYIEAQLHTTIDFSRDVAAISIDLAEVAITDHATVVDRFRRFAAQHGISLDIRPMPKSSAATGDHGAVSAPKRAHEPEPTGDRKRTRTDDDDAMASVQDRGVAGQSESAGPATTDNEPDMDQMVSSLAVNRAARSEAAPHLAQSATDRVPRAGVTDTQVSISDSPAVRARALFSDEGPTLPMSAASLATFVDGVAPKLPPNASPQDCVSLANWLLRRLYPRGLTNLATIDDSGLRRGGVTGAQAAVVDGPGWALVSDRDGLVNLIAGRAGSTAVLLVSRPGGAMGHVLAAHATTEGVRWLDIQRPADERVSSPESHPDRMPREVVSAPKVWALVIGPDSRVQTPGGWSTARPSVEALLDADTTRRFGSPGDDGDRSRVSLRDLMTRRRFSRTQRRMTQGEHNEVMGRLAAGDAVSLRREVERAENRRSTSGFEDQEGSAWAPQARRRLENVLGIAPEWSQHDLDRMVNHLMGSRVTHNFNFHHWIDHHGEFLESGERLVSGWENNAWSADYTSSRDASEREIGLYDRGRNLALDLDPAHAAAVRDRISRYMSRQSPLFRPAGRPHYGVLDYANARGGGARQYGFSFMVFKDHVKSRSTFTPADSLDQAVATQSATLVNLEKLLVYCHHSNLRRIHAWATQGGEPGNVPPHYGSNYIETQIHSDIVFARDIEALYIAETDLQVLDEQSAARAWAVLEGIAAQCGIRLARI